MCRSPAQKSVEQNCRHSHNKRLFLPLSSVDRHPDGKRERVFLLPAILKSWQVGAGLGFRLSRKCEGCLCGQDDKDTLVVLLLPPPPPPPASVGRRERRGRILLSFKSRSLLQAHTATEAYLPPLSRCFPKGVKRRNRMENTHMAKNVKLTKGRKNLYDICKNKERKCDGTSAHIIAVDYCVKLSMLRI